MAYEDTAPNLSKLLTEEEFHDMFPTPAPPAPPVPEPDGAKKAALVAAFAAEYNANRGSVQLERLARTQRVPLRWCEILMSEVKSSMGGE